MAYASPGDGIGVRRFQRGACVICSESPTAADLAIIQRIVPGDQNKEMQVPGAWF
jgi:hypothetical protein